MLCSRRASAYRAFLLQLCRALGEQFKCRVCLDLSNSLNVLGLGRGSQVGSAQADSTQPVARKKPFKLLVPWYGTEHNAYCSCQKGFFKAIRINNTPSCAGVTDLGTASPRAALLHTAGGVVLEAPRGFSVRNCWVCAPLSLSPSYSPRGRGLLCEHLCVESVQTPGLQRGTG